MRNRRFTEVQIIGVLKQAEGGMKVDEVCRQNGVSRHTFDVWRKKFGGVGVSEAKRLRQLEAMKPADRVSTIFAPAQRGDVIPTIAAESSYAPVPLVTPDIVPAARKLYAEATNPPATKAAEVIVGQEVLAERVAAEVLAKAQQALSASARAGCSGAIPSACEPRWGLDGPKTGNAERGAEGRTPSPRLRGSSRNPGKARDRRTLEAGRRASVDSKLDAVRE